MKNSRFTGRKLIGVIATAAVITGLLAPALSLHSPVAAYTVSGENKTVTYTFEYADFADGISQDKNSILTDGTAESLTFSATELAVVGREKAASSPVANVINLSKGKSRSEKADYSSESCYPSLAVGHNNVLRLGVNGESLHTAGGVMLNDGKIVLELSAGKYIIGFDYYATDAVKQNGTSLEIMNNASEVIKENGANFIGEKRNTLETVFYGKNAVTGSWQTVAYTLEINERSRNIGFYADNLKKDGNSASEIFIDNITVSVISTVSFETECDIMPISGEPGTEVYLPDENDVVVYGKQFAGWYADAEYTEPIMSESYVLPTNSLSVKLYAKMLTSSGEAPIAEFDFDSGSYAGMKANAVVDNVKVSGGLYSIADVSASGGIGKALAIKPARSIYDGHGRTIAFNDGSNWFTLQPGDYEISYRYMVADRKTEEFNNYNKYKTNAPFIKFVTNIPKNNSAATLNGIGTAVGEMLIDLTDATKDGSWHDGKVDITVSGSSAVTFGIRAEWLYFDIYLDNIKIKKPEAKEVTVTFDTKGGSQIPPMIGKSGTDFTVSNPSKDGFRFAGWYTNPGLTEPATMKYPNKDAVYYAKWADNTTLYTFEGDFKTGTINVGLVGGGMFNIASAPDNTENKTLLIGADRALYNGQSRAMKFNDGTEFLAVSAGDHIEITYKYYITDRQGDQGSKKGDFTRYNECHSGNAEIYLLERVMGNSASGISGEYAKESGKSKILMADVKNDTPNVWHTKTLTVDIQESGVLGLIATQVWADVYIDDMSISITQPRKVMVIFDSQGGSECPPLSVAAGFKFTLPTPTKDGYSFIGWFTEPDGAGTRASSTAPQTDIKYYAKWAKGDSAVFLDFENGLKPGHVNQVGSGFFKSGNGDTDHGKVMVYEPTNDLARPRMLDEKAKVLPDTDYIISFEYIVKSLPNSASFAFDFATALGTGNDVGTTAYEVYTRIAGKNLLSDVVPGNTDTVGKWKTANIVIHTPADVGTGYLAAFGVSGSGTVIWFDNMEITRVDKDSDPILYIDYGYDGITEVRSGKAGDPITLRNPVRDGYIFEGWLDENGNDFTAAQYPAHGVIYAYAVWYNSTPRIVTFDDMPEKLSKNSAGKYVTAACFSIVPEKGQGKTKALKYSQGNGQEKFFALNDGNTNLTVKKNTTYQVKVRYLRESGASQTTVCFATADASNWFIGRKVQSPLTKLESKKGIWQEFTIFFTPDKDGALFAGIKGGANNVIYIDNIEIRELSRHDVVLSFSADEVGISKYLVGRAGSPIDPSNIPVINVKNYVFVGWFIDKEYTTPFKGNVFPSKSMTVYAKTAIAEKYVIDFTDYPYEGDTTSQVISATVMSISRGGPSSDGDGCALLFDNTTEKQTGEKKKLILGSGSQGMPLQAGMSYLIAYDYYFIPAEGGGGGFSVTFANTNNGNMWSDYVLSSSSSAVNMGLRDAKKWYTDYSILTTDNNIKNKVLAASISVPIDAKVYIDNIRVLAVREGYAAIGYSTSSGKVPEPSVVKIGSTLKLPSVKTESEFVHLGWRDGDVVITDKSYTVMKSTVLLAEISVKKFTEGFEKTGYKYKFGKWGCEPDMEIYDSASNSNSADNVHGGRYSYHRIGKDPSFRAYSLQFNNYMSKYTLSSGTTYTVSMWVKVENPIHKLGAIELISSTKAAIPWSYDGDRYAIASIASIADGDWHEISFVITPVTHYLSIVTPGNLSIYIDDVTVEYTPDAVTSDSVKYDEYIPCLLNEDGTYSTGNENMLAAYNVVKGDPIADEENSDSFVGSSLFVTVIVCAAAVLLSFSTAAVLAVLNKKKGGK